MIKILVFCALGILVAILLFLWLITRVRYRIGSRHVKIIFLGLTIRRVAIASIKSVSKRRGDGLAEHWPSTTHPKHRLLVLRRNRGLFKNVIITPKNRYVFKTDLERAIQRVTGHAPEPTSEPDQPEASTPDPAILRAASDTSAGEQ